GDDCAESNCSVQASKSLKTVSDELSAGVIGAGVAAAETSVGVGVGMGGEEGERSDKGLGAGEIPRQNKTTSARSASAITQRFRVCEFSDLCMVGSPRSSELR